jgi:hypothetical protein
MNRLVRTIGCGLSLVAVVATLGGHWLALQSVAWARMVATFSRDEPILSAIFKTFDGKHPCTLCLKIQQGWQQEQKEQQKQPGVEAEKRSDLICEARLTRAPEAPRAATPAVPLVPILHADFLESPPTPPPRRA